MSSDAAKPSLFVRGLRGLIRICVTLAVIATAGAGVFFGQAYFVDRAADVAPPPPAPLINVAVAPIETVDGYVQTRSFVGQVEPARTVQTSFELPGQLATIIVDEGDEVAAGTTLATQNTDLLAAEQAQLLSSRSAVEAQLDFATQRRDRTLALLDRGFASQEQVDQVVATQDELSARLREIDARLDTISIRLAKSELVAPFDGRITRRFVDGGEALNPGQPIVEIVQTSDTRIRVGLPLSLDEGALRTATTSIDGRALPADLITIRPDIDPTTRTRTALYRPNPALNASFGETVEIDIQTQVKSQGAWVPTESLKEGERGQWTLLVLDADDVVRRTTALVVHSDQDRVFVQGAFPPGTRMIDAGTQRVVVGQRVAPLLAQEG